MSGQQTLGGPCVWNEDRMKTWGGGIPSGPVGFLGELVRHEDGRGRLTACGGDLLVLTGIADDITAGEDAGAVGAHVEVDLDETIVVQLDIPLLEVVEVCRDSDVDDRQVRGDDDLLVVLLDGDGFDLVGSVDGHQRGVHVRLDGTVLEVVDGRFIGPEVSPAVDDGCVRDGIRRMRP